MERSGLGNKAFNSTKAFSVELRHTLKDRLRAESAWEDKPEYGKLRSYSERSLHLGMRSELGHMLRIS